ncbi:MAG: hypothetical protein ABIH48_00060 [Candidatus Falkowbacteria bacterium]
MNAENYFKIISLIRDIKETDRIMSQHKDLNNNVDTLMLHQFLHKKDYLLKELFIALIKSGTGIRNFQPFLIKLSEYLKTKDEEQIVSEELRENISEIEKSLI